MAALRPSDGLFEQVAAYTDEAMSVVTGGDLSAPTPCSQWNLLDLMRHLSTSLGVLIQTLQDGRPDLLGAVRCATGTRPHAADLLLADDVGTVLATAVRYRTERLVRVHEALRRGEGPDDVLVGAYPLPRDLVAAAGAVELAVHSWDIATACGRTLPIPDAPALELLELSALVVDGVGRLGLFASAVAVPPRTPPGDRLVALLGRTPA